jgi:hypothetical protein
LSSASDRAENRATSAVVPEFSHMTTNEPLEAPPKRSSQKPRASAPASR